MPYFIVFQFIKQFMQWCEQGSETYIQRKNLFVKQKETVEAEIERLKHVLDVIEYKCWYYDEAIKDGNEERLNTMKIEDMPDKISLLKTTKDYKEFIDVVYNKEYDLDKLLK